MADQYEITSISKSAAKNVHEMIRQVCGKNKEGGKWRISQKKAVEAIEKKELAFYIMRNGKRAEVIVAGDYGKKYLKTDNDGDIPIDLLSLPES